MGLYGVICLYIFTCLISTSLSTVNRKKSSVLGTLIVYPVVAASAVPRLTENETTLNGTENSILLVAVGPPEGL
ncbi:MAG: hypothetical protein GX021_03090 [Tissierellia bacterium]|nr:hypothetical protein [Tissierellia bacterium]